MLQGLMHHIVLQQRVTLHCALLSHLQDCLLTHKQKQFWGFLSSRHVALVTAHYMCMHRLCGGQVNVRRCVHMHTCANHLSYTMIPLYNIMHAPYIAL